MESVLKGGPQIAPLVLATIKPHGEDITYQHNEHVIYKDHIPKFGFILLEGKVEVQLSRSSRTLLPFSIIGIKEVLLGTPYKNIVKVYSGTRILKLDRSALLEAQKNDDLIRFFDDILSNS